MKIAFEDRAQRDKEMTREEAIKELKEMIKYEWRTYKTSTAKTHVTALEMAIKALEQEPYSE